MSTITSLLIQAQGAVQLAKILPLSDPRFTLALQLADGAITIVQSLHTQGVFDPSTAIEVDHIGLALLENMTEQLKELGEDGPG